MTRFTIRYTNDKYRVSIPNYDGGEVVAAEDYDALERQLTAERAKAALAVAALRSALAKAEHDSKCPEEVNGVSPCNCHVSKLVSDLNALQSSDVLAEIRREVARECAEIVRKKAKDYSQGIDRAFAQHRPGTAKRLRSMAAALDKVASAICAKFGVLA